MDDISRRDAGGKVVKPEEVVEKAKENSTAREIVAHHVYSEPRLERQITVTVKS